VKDRSLIFELRQIRVDSMQTLVDQTGIRACAKTSGVTLISDSTVTTIGLDYSLINAYLNLALTF
jgi:hypothetical protein